MRYCGLYFKEGELIEIDHIFPIKSEGGTETSATFRLSIDIATINGMPSLRGKGIHDKDHMVEEPCAEKSHARF